MKNLLRLADPKYAETLERYVSTRSLLSVLLTFHSTSPLPFHALSNLLTLFSHDMPTLRLIQHTFDYLLCRPPVAIVYLATAVGASLFHSERRKLNLSRSYYHGEKT
jgi:hypothetical protein